MKKISLAVSVLVLLSIVLSACNLQAAAPTQLSPEQVSTIAKATVDALTTQMAPPPATATPLPTEAPTATPTLAVPTLDLTSIPTLGLATSTLIPLPTQASSVNSQCNVVFFINDETIPDGTVFKPGETFTKSWKIRNDGTCIWNTAYSAGPFSNDPSTPAITGDNIFKVPAQVVPGGILLISVTMKAPATEGTYTQVWKMNDAEGKPFGIGGPNGAGWWVNIKVSKTGSVTPSSVVGAASFSDPNYVGTITTTNASVNYSWQIYTGSSWLNLTEPTLETFNSVHSNVTSYTGGKAAACTLAGLSSGDVLKVRLNMNEYGYAYVTESTCP
jgi:hypothetical protein